MRDCEGLRPGPAPDDDDLGLPAARRGLLTRHNGAHIENHWVNRDLCNAASLMAIGILTDDRALFDRSVTYAKEGAGNGSIPHAVPFLHEGGLAQWQESGRDQGRTMTGVGRLGAVCEMAWSQGGDLYGFDDSRFLKAAEYVAKYNLGHSVPFTAYTWHQGQPPGKAMTRTVISDVARGQLRPVWEMLHHHYADRRGLGAVLHGLAPRTVPGRRVTVAEEARARAPRTAASWTRPTGRRTRGCGPARCHGAPAGA
ncbi:hypothetical protein GCM10009863_47280 [Streptomyces axinellae]|uniref:Alginate lyase domain-containing protein n=1 Tax=Streptomyces axinellae TaxID=552788 RepID=A0ABP6CRT1_9ACTN